MVHASNTAVTRKRRRKVLKQAKGYFGSKHKLFKTAKEQLMRSRRYAFFGRKQKKRDMRKSWILRLNNAFREQGIRYSLAIYLLRHFEELGAINLDRKQLVEMAIEQPEIFNKLVDKIKKVSLSVNS